MILTSDHEHDSMTAVLTSDGHPDTIRTMERRQCMGQLSGADIIVGVNWSWKE